MRKRLRIGIEVQRILRSKKHGMEVVALELIRKLQQLDLHNEYVVFLKDGPDVKCLAETANFEIRHVSGYTYADWEQIGLPAAVKKANVDFLHSTCNTSSLSLSTPLILTLHDIIYLENVNFKGTAYQNFGNLYRRYVVPKVVRKSDLIITVSHYERNIILENLKLPPEKVKVIYNAVNPKFNNSYSRDQLAAFKERFKLPDQFILFLGNTAPKKNTYNAIKAFSEYCSAVKNNIPMVILDFDKSSVEELLAKSGKAQTISNFIFPGYIPSNEMPLIYNLCTLFLYPSLRESFGLPILEAMACGAPVITSATSSMPEVAGGAALLVNPFKHTEIAEAIIKVLENSSLSKEMTEKGLKRSSEFTWEASARSLLDVYDNIEL